MQCGFKVRVVAINYGTHVLPNVWQVMLVHNPHVGFVNPLFVEVSLKIVDNGETIHKHVQLANNPKPRVILLRVVRVMHNFPQSF